MTAGSDGFCLARHWRRGHGTLRLGWRNPSSSTADYSPRLRPRPARRVRPEPALDGGEHPAGIPQPGPAARVESGRHALAAAPRHAAVQAGRNAVRRLDAAGGGPSGRHAHRTGRAARGARPLGRPIRALAGYLALPSVRPCPTGDRRRAEMVTECALARPCRPRSPGEPGPRCAAGRRVCPRLDTPRTEPAAGWRTGRHRRDRQRPPVPAPHVQRDRNTRPSTARADKRTSPPSSRPRCTASTAVTTPVHQKSPLAGSAGGRTAPCRSRQSHRPRRWCRPRRPPHVTQWPAFTPMYPQTYPFTWTSKRVRHAVLHETASAGTPGPATASPPRRLLLLALALPLLPCPASRSPGAGAAVCGRRQVALSWR